MAKRPPPSQSRKPPGTSARKRRKDPPPPPPPKDPTFVARCLDVAEVMLVALDAGGRITVANRKASAVLGWPEEELLGRDWFDTCVPEGARARVREVFAAIVGGDLAPAEQFENPVLTRTGDTRLIAWRNTLLKDDAGAIIGTLSSGQDITESRARQERVHLLSLVAEQVGEGVAVADPEGNLVWVNRPWAAMHGYEPEELVGKHLSVSHSPAQLESDVIPFNERVLARGSHHGEVGHIRKDGTHFPTEMTTTLLRGDDGAILGFLGTARDISEEKRAERDLRATRQRLEALLSSSPIVLYACEAHGDFAATFVSGTVEAILGYSPEDFTSDHGFWVRHIHPEDAPGVLEDLASLFERGTHHHQYRFLHADGTYRWLQEDLRLLRDPSGRPLQIVGSLVDITDRKEAEVARLESESKYRKVFEGISEGIYVSTVDGHPVLANPALVRMLGFDSEEDLLRRDIAKEGYAYPEERERFHEIIERDGRVVDFEAHWHRKDGSVITVLLNSRGVRGPDGRVALYEGLVRDITESRRAEEALRRSEERFRIIVEHSTNLFYSHTPDHVLTYVSPRSEEFFDCAPDEALVRWTEFVTENPLNGAGFESTQRAIDTGVAQPPYELELKTRKGRLRWVQVNEAPVVREGKTVAVVGALTDITERKAAQEAAQSALDRLQAVVEHTPLVAIQGFDREGRVTLWNPASESIYGYAAGEALGRRLDEFLLSGDAASEFRSVLARIWESGQATPPLEWPVKHRDGSTRWVYSTTFPLFEGGKVTAAFCMDVDVTKRRLAEDSLRESEFWLRESQRASRIGSYSLDIASGRWVASPTLDDLFGLDSSDDHSVEAWGELLHPEDREEMTFYLRDEVIGRGRSFDREYRIVRRRDGATRWVLGRGELVPGPDGRPSQMIGTVHDITERKVAEEALRDSEARYRLLVETVREIIYFVEVSEENPGGRLAFISPQVRDLLGYEPETLLGDPAKLLGLLHPRDRSAALASFRTLLSGSGPESREFRLQHRVSGEYRWVEDMGIPVRDAQGRVLGFQGVARDITDRKVAEDLVRRKNLQLLSLVDSSEALGKLDFPSAAWVICEAARVAFKAKLVWIGLVTPDSTEVLPIASAGDDDGYTRLIRVRWDESPRSQGPTGRCIKRRQPVTMSIYDEAFAPWRSEALRRGFQVVCALPLLHEDHVRGAITFYSEDPLGFPPDSAEVMGLFARQTVLALVNASLYQEARESVEELLRKERDLSLQTAYFRELFESSPEAVAIVDQDDHIKDINREFTRLFQWEPEEVRGRLINDVVVPDHLRDGAGTISKTVLNGEVVQAQELRRKKDGTLFPVFILGAPIRIAGERHGVLAIYRDMSDIQASVDEVRKFQFMVEGSSQEIYLLRQDGSLAYVNLAAAESLGYTREEMIAAGIDGFDMTVGGRFREHFEKNRDRGFPPFEAIHRAKDGTLRTKEIRGAVVTIGGEEFICGFGQDVTERRRAEEAMRIRDHALATSVSAVAMSDLDGKLTYVNRAFLDLWGYADEGEILGRSSLEFWRSREEAGKVVEALAGEGQWNGRMEGTRRDGDSFVAELSAHMVKGPEGKPLCMMASFLDVTDRVRAEEAVRRSEALYRGFVENARAIVLAWDPCGTVTFWNDFAAEFFGYPREEILGQSLFDTIVPRLETTGRDLEGLLLHIGKDPDQYASNINQNRTKDGRLVWVAWANRPILSPDGRVESVVSYGTDITALIRAEQALGESERKYKALVETTHTGYVILDPEGLVLDANAEYVHLTGRSSLDELKGRSVVEWTAPEDRERNAAEVRRCLGGGFVEGLEVRYQTPEGRVVPVEVNATVVPDAGEIRILSLVRDISERKGAEEELVSVESRMKAIVDSVPECIKLIDADGILLDINPAGLAMLGATLEQVRGQNAGRIVTPEYREAFREFTRRVCGGERASAEFEILNLKGQHLRVSSSAAPLRLRPGGPAVCLAITRVIGPDGAGA